jgi:hypothetical protein
MKTLLTALALLSATLPAAAQTPEAYRVAITPAWICTPWADWGVRYCVDTTPANMGNIPQLPAHGNRMIVTARMAAERRDGFAVANASFVTLCHATNGSAGGPSVYKIVRYKHFEIDAAGPFSQSDVYAKSIGSLVCINFGARND